MNLIELVYGWWLDKEMIRLWSFVIAPFQEACGYVWSSNATIGICALDS